MEYSVIKKNELCTHAMSWMNLKISVLSERSQVERNIFHNHKTDFMIPIIKNSSRKCKVSYRK